MLGLVGELVRRMSAATEADPASLWLHAVVGLGSMIGHGPYLLVDGGRAHLNMYGAIVGETSRARKGTAWRRVRPALIEIADPAWLAPGGGLSSAEGLVERLTDSDGGDARPGEPAQGRAWFAVESEMSTVWKRARFEGSTLLEAMREFYDCGDYAIHRRNGASVSGAHLSLVAHSTREELLEDIEAVNLHNGVANRIVWFAVRRVRNLPLGATTPDLAEAISLLRLAVRHARNVGEIRLTRAAIALYRHVYGDLLADVGGLAGKIMARAEHHPLRFGGIFAAIDAGSAMKPSALRVQHLLAGLEATRFGGDSVNWIFGGHVANPAASKVLALLRDKPEGVARTELHRAMGNNAKTATLDAAIEYLAKQKLCIEEEMRSGGPGAPRRVVRLNPENPEGRVPLQRPWASAMERAREFARECKENDEEPVECAAVANAEAES